MAFYMLSTKTIKRLKNGRGIVVHLYQDVKHYGFIAEGINLLKIELEDDNRDAIYIPMSNIDLKYYKTNDSQKETSNQWDMC